MRYIQVEFTANPDNQDIRDIIAALAGDNGFESFSEDKGKLIGYCQEELFHAESLENTLQNFPIPDVEITFTASNVEDRNWNEEWEKAGFDPIIIDNQCAIVCGNKLEDANHQQDIDSIPTKIVIDAKQAFGTGTHETTQMIVSLLLSQNLTGKRVLDCGCGTGILGIVTAKYGAKEVVAYDIDEWSVSDAQHNAELNEVELDVLEGDKRVLSHVNGVFDYVLANINRNIILEDLSAFVSVMTTNSRIILSGFYEQDVEIILKEAENLGLEECKRVMNHNWCCLLLEKI